MRGVEASSPTVDQVVGALIADCYGNHDGLPGRAAELIRRAEATGDRRTADIGRLVLAELDARNGRVPVGLARAGEILRASDDRVVVAKAHAVIANGLWRVGDNGEAVRHAYTASRMLTAGDPLALRVDHAILLAVQVNDQRGGEIAHEEFRFAQELADECGRPSLVQANLNNWAWCCYARGDLPRAAELARQMQDNSTVSGAPINMSSADTVARILLETGHPAEAGQVIERAIAGAPATDADAVPAALVTLAEIQQRGGDVHAALRTLERCRALAVRDDLAEHGAIALRMLAACHAELGDFRTAYREMVEFHEAWTVRRSEKSEVVARVAHAQFAVDEAERTTERFREMAERGRADRPVEPAPLRRRTGRPARRRARAPRPGLRGDRRPGPLQADQRHLFARRRRRGAAPGRRGPGRGAGARRAARRRGVHPDPCRAGSGPPPGPASRSGPRWWRTTGGPWPTGCG